MPDSPPDTLAPVGAVLRAHADRFRDLVQNQLYSAELQSRQIFPMRAAESHRDLAVALAWALERTSADGTVAPDALARMRRLGMAHRRHGFPSQLYESFAGMLTSALETIAAEDDSVDDRLRAPAARAINTICFAMQASAHTADLSGIPSAWVAEVTDVIRHSRRISTVRLESGSALAYEPGQYVPVTTNYLPGIWRSLVPAYPADDYGTLEFHLQIVEGGAASALLAAPRVGDFWSIGAARGELAIRPEARTVIIAYGTGLATAKSLILGQLGRTSPTPRVRLIMAAEYPGELYELSMLTALAAAVDWLEITPVSQSPTNPWWLTTVPQRQPATCASAAELVDALVTDADIADAEFILAGPSAAVDETVVRLSARGTKWLHIQLQRFDSSELWSPPW